MAKGARGKPTTFKVGQTVYAVKGRGAVHRYGYTSAMDKFADGAAGIVTGVSPTTVQVHCGGKLSYSYTPQELSHTPRDAEVVVFKPIQEKPTKAEKTVDTDIKTLYAIVRNGVVIGVHPTRRTARTIKTSLGGKKAGITIVTYKAGQEIR